MYITADAGDAVDGEAVLAGHSFTSFTKKTTSKDAPPAVHGIGGPSSVDSTDVQKAGQVFTNTPDGRMRLTDYLSNVEKEIAAEAAARKRDVANVRAQMDRNMAFNEKARAALKKALLIRMKKNEKKTKSDLHKAMRWTQMKFHKAAELSNKREKINAQRSKMIRKKVAADKRHAAAQLKHQVLAQQRAMAALASSINARIKRTNKHVAMNAAQIKSNAIAAQKALEKAVSIYDRKAADAKNLAAKGRSKLAAQLRAQGKATRQWANNKLKVVIAKTAAQFRRVRAKMQRDRHHADFALKSATSRMTASLNAFKALNDKRFAKNVKRIKAARREAKLRVARAKAEFRVRIRSLRATVHKQVSKTNTRITQLSGVVDKDKLAQAKVNSNVRAEMDRMIKIGNQRYKQHLKKDAELKRLVMSNKAANTARLKAMANHYAAELDKIRATMKKNRAHASRMLAKKTAALYSAIAKAEKAQMKENGRLAKLTRDARLDIADNLRKAKADFAKRMASLHTTVIKNDKKFEKKMDKLTGIVRANAVKNAKGRANIAALQKANYDELKAAVQQAVHKGETEMMQVENKLKTMNKKTKQSLNMRITAKISSYAKAAAKQIEGVRLSSKKAREEMRKELLYAVRSAAAEAKKNLAAAYKQSSKMFNAAAAKEAAAARKSAAARAKLAASIAAEKKAAQKQLNDAVGTMSRSLSALKAETHKKISKANHRVSAYADQLAKEQKEVNGLMKAQLAKLMGNIKGMRGRVARATGAANEKSAAGFSKVRGTIAAALKKADAKAKLRFAKLFAKMTAQRKAQNHKLKREVGIINDKIAKQAALEDSRFKKTVKNIAAARAAATAQVKAARKSFATRIQTTTAAIKDQESRLLGEIKVVGEELISHRATQLRVNRRTQAEMARVRAMANHRYSVSKRARGKLRRLLDENKKAAHEEVKALDGLFTRKLTKVRTKATNDARAAGRDLRRSTAKLYGKLAKIQLEASFLNKKNAKQINHYAKKSQAAIRAERKSFNARLNTLANRIASNNRKAQKGLEVLTGVIRRLKSNGKKDRALIRSQNKALGLDLQAKIDRYIQEGEARAKRIAHRARRNLAAAKKSMLLEISARVEATADKLFKMIQGKHKTIADNYLSLKAYAVSAKSMLTKYVIAGKGKNLSSLGEILIATAAISSVKVPKTTGLGAGSGKIPSIFSAKYIKVPRTATAINGIVDEYSSVLTQVRSHWPMGLGRYLLMKFEESMLAKGVLQVDKISSKAGNFVFVNGRTVGLSNKLNDFEGLAVRMVKYEAVLAKLTAKLAGKVSRFNKKHVAYVKPPQWTGN
jgi:histone H1/5